MPSSRVVVVQNPTNARRVVPVLSSTGSGPFRHVYEVPYGAPAEKVYPILTDTVGADRVYFDPAGGNSWLWSLVFGNGTYPGLYCDFTSLTPVGGLAPLYTAYTGVTPVAAHGNTIGLALDSSQGAAIGGTDYIADYDLASIATWGTGNTAGAEWNLGTPGQVSISTASASADLYPPENGGNSSHDSLPADGAVLLVEIDYADVSGSISVFGGHTAPIAIGTGTGTFTMRGVKTSKNMFLRAAAGATGTIIRCRVRRVLGNHAYQSTSGSRGTWSSDGYWLGDGSDDHLISGLLPGNDMTIIAAIYPTAASDAVAGTMAASDTRSLGFGTDASGNLTLMLGDASLSTSAIKGSADIRNAWSVASAIGAGTTGTLRHNGEQIAAGAVGGSINTTIAYLLGAFNSNGTAAATLAGRIARMLIVKRSNMPAALLAKAEKSIGAGFVSI